MATAKKTTTKSTPKAASTKSKSTKKTPVSKTGAKSKATANYFYALGRRKTATATVRLFDSKGKSEVNGKLLDEVYPHQHELVQIQQPLMAAGLNPEQVFFTVKVSGGGTAAQLDAIKLGLARAIVKMDPTLKPALKKEGLLTRDPRMVERKKPGLRKARRAEQFSKR